MASSKTSEQAQPFVLGPFGVQALACPKQYGLKAVLHACTVTRHAKRFDI